jgi:hypothetical protein
VSRAQVGANSGHVRDEHRITPSGIGRPPSNGGSSAASATPGARGDTLHDPPKLLREFGYRISTRFGGSTLAAGFLGQQRFDSARRVYYDGIDL